LRSRDFKNEKALDQFEGLSVGVPSRVARRVPRAESSYRHDFHKVSRARGKARSQSNGGESHRQSHPVTVVVISSAEKGDRLDGSLEVKVPMAGKFPVRSAQGASNLTGRSRSEPGSLVKPHLREADRRLLGRAEPLSA